MAAVTTGPSRDPRPARVWCGAMLVLGALYAALNPPLAVQDEIYHLARAYALSRGELRVHASERGFESRLPEAFRELSGKYAGLPRDPKRRASRELLQEQLQARLDTRDSFVLENPLPTLSPSAYSALQPGIWLARALSLPPVWCVYLARLSGLGVFCALLYQALALVGGLAWPLFALALAPALLTQAAGATPDSLTTALAFLFLALVERASAAAAGDAFAPRSQAALAAVFVALVSVNPACALFGLLLPTLAWRGTLTPAARWGATALLIALSGLLAGALGYVSAGRNPLALTELGAAQLGWALHHPIGVLGMLRRSLFRSFDDYFLQTFAAPFPLSSQMRFSAALVAGLYAELLLLLTLGTARHEPSGAPHKARWYGLAALLFVGSVFGEALLISAKVGPGRLQNVFGRLFFPAAPLLLAALAQLGRPIARRFLLRRGGIRVLLATAGLNLIWLLMLVARFYAANKRPWKY